MRKILNIGVSLLLIFTIFTYPVNAAKGNAKKLFALRIRDTHAHSRFACRLAHAQPHRGDPCR